MAPPLRSIFGLSPRPRFLPSIIDPGLRANKAFISIDFGGMLHSINRPRRRSLPHGMKISWASARVVLAREVGHSVLCPFLAFAMGYIAADTSTVRFDPSQTLALALESSSSYSETIAGIPTPDVVTLDVVWPGAPLKHDVRTSLVSFAC